MQDILCIFMSRDNTRNNHVNRERKKIIYSTWYETILISSMIRAVPTTFSNLLTQPKTGLLSCLICTVRAALFTPVGSSALNSAVRTDLNNTVDNNAHRVQHNTVHVCSEQHCSCLLTSCNSFCVFTCVYKVGWFYFFSFSW